MNKRKETGLKKNPFVIILDILIAVTLIVALILLGRMNRQLRESYARDPYNSIAYSLREGDYGSMVKEYYRRGYDIDPFSSDNEEEYHLAGYADAAFRARFYEAVGNTAQAERLRRKQEAERAALGSLAAESTAVDSLVEAAGAFSDD